MPAPSRVESPLWTLPMFASLSPLLLERLDALVCRVHIPAGAEVVSRSDTQHTLAVIVDGRAQAFDGHRSIRVLGPNDAFGAELGRDPIDPCANARAMTEGWSYRSADGSLSLHAVTDVVVDLLDLQVASVVIDPDRQPTTPGADTKADDGVRRRDTAGDPVRFGRWASVAILVGLAFAAWLLSGCQPQEPPPTVTVTVAGATGAEPAGATGSTTVPVTVSLSGPVPSPVTVDWTTADGSATAASGDYQSATGTVTFAPNETSKTIDVAIEADDRHENPEVFQVNLAAPTGSAILGADATASVTITDDPSDIFGDCTKWAVAGSVSWDNPDHWTPAGAPGSDDVVCATKDSSISMSTSGTVRGVGILGSLNIPGGTWLSVTDATAPWVANNVGVSGQLNVAGDLTLSGASGITGTVFGPGTVTVEAGATLQFWMGGLHQGATLSNHGTVTWAEDWWAGTNFDVCDGSQVINHGLFVMDGYNARTMTDCGAVTSRFTNAADGTVTFSIVYTRAFDIEFVNHGAVTVTHGTILLNRANSIPHTGTFTIADPGTLNLRAKTIGITTTHQFGATARVAGTSGLVLDDAWATANGAPGSQFSNVTITAGVLTGSPTITSGGSLWAPGRINGPGTTTIAAGAHFYWFSGMLGDAVVLENHGILDWTEQWWDAHDGSVSLCDGARIDNHGVLDATGSRTQSMLDCGGNPRLVNHTDGTIDASTTSWMGTARNLYVDFQNDGTVNVVDGQLNLLKANTVPYAGTFNLAASTSILRPLAPASDPQTNTFAGTARVSGLGTLVIDNSFTTVDALPGSQFAVVSLTNGVLTGDPTITGGGSMRAPATINGPGTTTIAPGAYFYWFTGTLDNGAIIDNHGTLDWSENWWDARDGSVSMCGGARIDNHGVLDATGSRTQSMLDCGGNPRLVNHTDGTIDASTTSWMGTARNLYVDVENDGVIKVSEGRLHLDKGISNVVGDTITGGTFNLSGTLSVGTTTTGQVTTNASNLIFHPAGALLTGDGQPLLALATNGPAGQLTYDRDDTIAALVNQGSVVVSSGRTLTAAAYTQTAGSTTLAAGTLAVPAGTVALDGGTLAGVGTIDASLANQANVVAGAATDPAALLTVTGGVTNTGRVTVTAGATLGAGAYAQADAAAVTDLEPGATLRVGAGSGTATLDAGTLAGSGTIAGHLAGGATIDAGALGVAGSTGILTVTGNYTASAGALIVTDVVDGTPGSGHDRLTVGASADVGQLSVAVAPAPGAALAGVELYPVSAATRVGAAAAASLPDGTGLLWQVDSYKEKVRVRAIRFDLSGNPTSEGGVVTFTAALGVFDVTPSGPVTFRDGTTVVGTAPFMGNAAVLTVPSLAPGAHSLTASFAGVAGVGAGVTTPRAHTVFTCDVIGPGADLSGCNLSGRDLTGIDLTGATLHGTNLSRAILTGTILAGADLTGVRSGLATGTPASLPSPWRLTGGYLVGPGADLSGADFSTSSAAVLTGADLTGANLVGASFWRAHLTDVTFEGADLRGANLREAVIESSNLRGADLRGAGFGDIAGSSVCSAPCGQLLDDDLTGADLTGASLIKTRISSDLSAALLGGADLRFADLGGSTLQGAQLATTAIRGLGTCTDVVGVPAALSTDWYVVRNRLVGPEAHLCDADLSGLDLSGARLRQAHVERTNLTGTNLSGADLHLATIDAGTALTGTNLAEADLTSAVLSDVTMDATNLTGANLGSATISGVTATAGTDLTGATLTSMVLGFSNDLRLAVLTGVRSGGITGPSYSTQLPAGWKFLTTHNVPGGIDGHLAGPGADLSGETITGVQADAFDGVSLAGANLAGSTIAAQFTNTDFQGANLTNTAFQPFGTTFSHVHSGGIVGSPASLPSGGWTLKAGHLVGPWADLQDADLATVDLAGANLYGANLAGAGLAGANLAGADLDRADLSGADLTDASGLPLHYATATYGNTTCPDHSNSDTNAGTCANHPWGYVACAPGPGADLSHCDLHGADLSHLDLTGAIFVGADLSGANLTLANLTGADLRGANLERTNLAWAGLFGVRSGGVTGMPFVTAPYMVQYGYLIGPYVDLSGIDLTGHGLAGRSFYGARLVGAHLDGAYLDHVDLSEADLTGATVTGADTSWASFKDANLTGADFAGSSLLAADLRGANLTGARLVNNNLFGVSLDRANLENATVDQATLWGARGRDIVGTAAQLPAGTRIVHGMLVGPGAIVDGGDLAGEDLSDLSLARTSFWGVDLSGTSFVGVDLTDSIFSGANLTGTRFDGANLGNVGLYSVEVGGADFTGAQVAVPGSCSITGTPASLPAPYRLTRGFLVGPGTRFVACSGDTVDLAGADLAGADLSGASLRGADLSGADLTGAVLRDANLDEAILTGAVVTNTDFTATSLIHIRSGGLVGAPAVLPLFWAPFDGYLVGPGANLAGANFADTDLRGLWMSNTDLTGTDLRRAVLTGVNLFGADLTGALVAGASFAGADLRQANLIGLDFAGIDLSGADLQLAWLDGADLSSALLARAHTASVRGVPAALPAGWFQFDRTLLGAGADLRLADLSGIDLAGRDLRLFDFTGVVLDGADLSNADLTGVRLTSAWAQSANLAGAVLVGADLSSANLYGANLAGAVLVGADLSWASIHQSNLVGADLSGATATGTYFREADLSGATLANLSGYGSNFELAQVVGADLSHADLTRSYSPGANFAGADFTGTTFWVAELPGANLAGARLSGAYVRQADLSGVDLTDADLSSATLVDTNLANATLVRADLTGVTAERPIITGADVTGTMLAGSGLHRPVSGGLTGVPASLPGRAVVVNGYLVGRDADLTSADLTGADLTGVDLGEARVQDTDLTGATLDGVSSGWISGYPTALPAGWSVAGNGYLVGPGADLIGANLGGADLRKLIAKGTNFKDADLSYADLSGARLGGATFTGSNLSHTQMHATDLDDADLSSANLYGVNSSDITTTPAALPAGWQLVRGHLVGAGAFLSGADLAGADLSGIDLSGATFETAVLTGADLSGADLHGAWLRDAHLTGADLTGADLTGTFGWWADLTGATLTGATITDANFTNAIFTGVISGGVIGQPADSVNRPHFVQGYFIGAGSNLTGADLAGADLRGYGLPGAVLVDADLSYAHLDGVDLSGANLHGATFEFTSAVSAGLYRVDLSGATIRTSDLHGAGLAYADLTNATITGSNLDGAVFADATLTGVVSSGNSGTPIYLPAGWSWVGGAFVGP